MGKLKSESELISPTTILIVSTFMIGVAVGRFGDDLSPFVLAGGLSGFLAFFVLDLANSRRSQKLKRQIRSQVEERLERHAHSISNSGLRLADDSESDDATTKKKRWRESVSTH